MTYDWIGELKELEARGEITGCYADIPIEIYHDPECPGVSSSQLELIEKGIEYYSYWKSGRAKRKETPALILGSAIHDAILLPEVFNDKYVRAENIKRTTKQGKEEYAEFLNANIGKTVLSQDDYDHVCFLRDRVFASKEFESIDINAVPEHTFFWVDEETGILCKCRADLYRKDGIVIDLKTTSSASAKDFQRTIVDRYYDRSAAFYLDGISEVMKEKHETFIFVAIEKEAPYSVRHYLLDAESRETGRNLYKRALRKLVDYQVATAGLVYINHGITKIGVPEWAHNLDRR